MDKDFLSLANLLFICGDNNRLLLEICKKNVESTKSYLRAKEILETCNMLNDKSILASDQFIKNSFEFNIVDTPQSMYDKNIEVLKLSQTLENLFNEMISTLTTLDFFSWKEISMCSKEVVSKEARYLWELWKTMFYWLTKFRGSDVSMAFLNKINSYYAKISAETRQIDGEEVELYYKAMIYISQTAVAFKEEKISGAEFYIRWCLYKYNFSLTVLDKKIESVRIGVITEYPSSDSPLTELELVNGQHRDAFAAGYGYITNIKKDDLPSLSSSSIRTRLSGAPAHQDLKFSHPNDFLNTFFNQLHYCISLSNYISYINTL